MVELTSTAFKSHSNNKILESQSGIDLNLESCTKWDVEGAMKDV